MEGLLLLPPEPWKVHQYLCICTRWLKHLCYCTKYEQQLIDLYKPFLIVLPSPWNAESSEPWIIGEFKMWIPGNLLPESPPSLSQGRPNSKCTAFSEMLMSYCRTVFLAFSHIDCPSSFYFQLPCLYLEDAMYSFPLKLMGLESYVQILMLEFKK